MNTSAMEHKNILLPTDFSATANKAFYHAASLADLFGSSITLLHILEDRRGPLSLEHDPDLLSKVQHQTESELADYAQEHRYEGVPLDTKVIHSHGAGDAIIQEAEGFDMIVMGRHGQRTLGKRLLGSVSQALMHETPVPLLNVRGDHKTVPERILVPIDFSDVGKLALDYAKAIAQKTGAQLELLHVAEIVYVPSPYVPIYNPILESHPELEGNLLTEMKGMVTEPALASSTLFTVLQGNAAVTIIDHAEESGADLIVLATHGRTGLDRFLIGSVAEKVMRSAGCPVLLLPSFAE